MAEDDLNTLMKWTHEDFEANRKGLLSEMQKTKLKLAYPRIFVLIGVITSILIAINIIFYLLFSFNDVGEYIRNNWLGIVFSLVIIIWWIRNLIINVFVLRNREINEGMVHAVEDRVIPSVKPPNLIKIQDMSFSLPPKIFKAFDFGEIYRIYYLPHSKTFISAEKSLNQDLNSKR